MDKRHYKKRRRKAGKQTGKQANKQATLPQGEFTTRIPRLLTDGRGMATVNGKAVMLSGALPDEIVTFRYRHQKQQWMAGEVTTVVSPSPDRIQPACPIFDVCGGCALQHLQPDKQLFFKQQQLLDNLKKQANIQPKTVTAPLAGDAWGYRHRARLGIQAMGERIAVGFRGRYSSRIIPIIACPVLSPALSALLTPLTEMLGKLATPKTITQVEMAQGEPTADNPSGTALNFHHVAALTSVDLQQLEAFSRIHRSNIYLQHNDSDGIHGLDHDAALQYTLALETENDRFNQRKHHPLTLRFMPHHFTQVNREMNQRMLTQALNWLDLQTTDEVLDLFCGLGNFTLPIAQRVKQVVGIEGAKPLVEWAQKNARHNGIDNANFYQADLTQDTAMMSWRVKHRFNKVLLDPPRAGAWEVLALLKAINPEKICYVSCHPATLARDADILVNQYGYRVKQCGVMDMFPHTAHVESMMLLEKNKNYPD